MGRVGDPTYSDRRSSAFVGPSATQRSSADEWRSLAFRAERVGGQFAGELQRPFPHRLRQPSDCAKVRQPRAIVASRDAHEQPRSRRVAPQPRLEARLLEVMIVSQRAGDPALLQDDERDAIRQRPLFVGPHDVHHQSCIQKL